MTTQLHGKNVTHVIKLKMKPLISYVALGLIILLWGSYYFQMSTDKKRFAVGLIGEPFHDPSSDFEDEPIQPTPFGEELAHLVVQSGQKRFIQFFQDQMSYNKEHSHSFDLKGSIHAGFATTGSGSREVDIEHLRTRKRFESVERIILH